MEGQYEAGEYDKNRLGYFRDWDRRFVFFCGSGGPEEGVMKLRRMEGETEYVTPPVFVQREKCKCESLTFCLGFGRNPLSRGRRVGPGPKRGEGHGKKRVIGIPLEGTKT